MADEVKQSGWDGGVEVRFEGDLGIIVIRRGQNRVNEQFVDQINNAMDKILANPDARAMATLGEGRFYGNGLDLDWLTYIAGSDPERLQRFAEAGFTQLMSRLVTFPLPTIALLNGHAFAAGGIMALFHDHVIMRTGRGWWCVNEVHIGRTFGDFLLEMCKLKLGRTYTDAVVIGRRYTAEQAKTAGIIQETCAADELVATARTWMAEALPPDGYDRSHFSTMKEEAFKVALQHAATPSKL